MRRFLDKIAPRRGRGRKHNPEPPHQTASDVTGLRVIYEGTSCRVDIVAIHGDGGHYKESWTHPENQVFWLRDLLPGVVPDSRILSFGYSAPKTAFVPAKQISLALLEELVRLRKGSGTDEKRPILFLAHSFGVLLLKGALATSYKSDEFKNVVSSTRSIIFFGSPPDISRMLQGLVSSLPMAQGAASPGFVAMQEDLTWLQETDSDYRELEEKGDFDTTYFLESSGHEGRHDTGKSSILADTDHEQGKFLRLRKTHGMMIRFTGAEDDDFRRVKECIEQSLATLEL